MRTKSFSSLASITFAFALTAIAASVSAQSVSASAAGGTQTRPDKSIEYRNGAVLTGTQIVYLIWYGDIKLGQCHYLLQRNWVNGKKGHCGLSLTQ